MSRRIAWYEAQGDHPDDDEDLAADERGRRRPPRLAILLEGDGFTVVNKPAGIATVPERYDRDAPTVITVLGALWRREDPERGDPVICHRLDKDTSGCLVVAHDRSAARAIMRQFRTRDVEKSYLALTLGAPQPPEGDVEIRLRQDRYQPGVMYVPRKGGKKCTAHYETVEAFRGLALVRVRPETGRTHQVRVTLRELGTPCAIDPLYGSADPLLLSRWKRSYRTGRGREERPLMERLTLHSERLGFHPPRATDADERVMVEAPLPKDLRSTLTQLRKHASPGSL